MPRILHGLRAYLLRLNRGSGSFAMLALSGVSRFEKIVFYAGEPPLRIANSASSRHQVAIG